MILTLNNFRLLVVFLTVQLTSTWLSDANATPTSSTSNMHCQESALAQEELSAKGVVVDDSDNPIDGANIVVDVFEMNSGSNRASRRIGSLETQSNSDGEYKFNLTDLKSSMKSLWIHVTASSPGYCERKTTLRPGQLENNGEVPKIKLSQGRKIEGQLLPDSEGDVKLLGGEIYFYASVLSHVEGQTTYMGSVQQTIKTDDQGKFSVVVPKETKVCFAATAEGFGIGRYDLSENETEPISIELPKGTSVVGAVLSASGKPMPGVVVQLRERRFMELQQIIIPIKSSVMTDAKGKFRLPHHRGKCTVCVCLNGGSTFGDSLYPDPANLPAIMPVDLELKGTEGQFGLILREGKTRLLSGKVVFEDGSPATKISAVLTVMGGSSSVRMCEAITDQSGNYKLILPAVATKFGVRVVGKRDDEGEMLYGMPDPHPDKKRASLQSIWFETDGEQDVTDVDWTLRHRK